MRTLESPWDRMLARQVTRPPEGPRGVILHQRGEMRLESGKWVPFTAEQTFEATRCAFVWHARARVAPLVTVVVEDAYEDGHGRLEAKLFGAIRVAGGEPGVDLDRGELLRYLAELPFNPLALLHNPDLHFEASSRGARVWAGDPTTWVDFSFDDAGLPHEMYAGTRVRGGVGVQPWGARFSEYADMGDAHVPVRAEVWWGEGDAREVYWRGEITDFAWR